MDPNLVYRTPGVVDDRAEALFLHTVVGAESKLIVATLAFAGLLGLAVATRMSRIVQNDVQALLRASSDGADRDYRS